MRGQEVSEAKCHGANTDHLKTVRERAKSSFHGHQLDGSGRFAVKGCDGVCVCVRLCVCVCV